MKALRLRVTSASLRLVTTEHEISKHEGSGYPSISANMLRTYHYLHRHKESMHEGIRYLFDTGNESMKVIVNYPCVQCTFAVLLTYV